MAKTITAHFHCRLCKVPQATTAPKPNLITYTLVTWTCKNCNSILMTRFKFKPGRIDLDVDHNFIRTGEIPSKKQKNPFDKMSGND